MSDSPVFGTVADREAAFVGHFTQRSATLTELEAVLTELCASYTELLELGRARRPVRAGTARRQSQKGYCDAMTEAH